MKTKIPLLEHALKQKAIIEPSELTHSKNVPMHCVLCFFKEVTDKIISKKRAKILNEEKWEFGVHRIYEMKHRGKRIAFCHPMVGAPLAAAILETLVALGCKKFIVCGGAGVLNKKMWVGHVVVPASAIRDEGTSYHYLSPNRLAKPNTQSMRSIITTLEKYDIPYKIAKTWTTDGVYRETPSAIRKRKAEGCLTVEMEAAALFAVAQYRKVQLAQLLYCGDDVSGAKWNARENVSRKLIREKLFWIAVEACLLL